jgi:outer membrane protein OmpA-like peptidoglycan-associated protein/peptidoglycan hydrolase-like protein with peptidoglycan-binding domain
VGTIRVTRRQLAAGVKVPLDERTTIVVGPTHVTLQAVGGIFEPNKSLPLPGCTPLLKAWFVRARQASPTDVVVAAHGDSVDNDAAACSDERAKVIGAWLEGNVDVWLALYDSAATKDSKWGAREDALLIEQMPGFDDFKVALAAAAPTQRPSLVAWYQKARSLEVDGIAGPQTRGALIREYFGLTRTADDADGSSPVVVQASGEPLPPLEVAVTPLGCADNFPYAKVLEEVASREEDPPVKRIDAPESHLDRRLELFLFDRKTGIFPPAAGPSGDAYLEWLTNGNLELSRVPGGDSVVLSILSGLLFETNKSFLLPNAVPALARLLGLYASAPSGALLVVGHTDTTAEPSINDPLSLERAESVSAYLKDDVDTWLSQYTSRLPDARRWGSREDSLMIQSLPGFDPGKSVDDVRQFQLSRGLIVDGIAGPVTRRALITEYMSHDGTTVPATVELTAHGCGENFPLDDRGANVEVLPEDEKEDQLDRRVELFLFDGPLGVSPPPPGKNSAPGSKEYPAWRAQAKKKAEDVGAGELASQIHVQLLTEDGVLVIPRATVRVRVASSTITAVSSESGIVFIAAVPPGDHAATVTTDDGISGDIKLPSNALREVARQVSVPGIPSEPAKPSLQELVTTILGDDDEPMAGVHYELKLADGRIVEGVTNSRGQILESELPQGPVQVVLRDTEQALADAVAPTDDAGGASA